MADKLLTIQEVADRLDIHHNTVYLYVKWGLLKIRRIGIKMIRVEEKDLEDFIHRHNNRGGE